jgi:hypothetical protein
MRTYLEPISLSMHKPIEGRLGVPELFEGVVFCIKLMRLEGL